SSDLGVSVLDAGPFACHPGAAFAGDSRPGVLTDHRAHGHGGHRSTASLPPTRAASATWGRTRADEVMGPRRSRAAPFDDIVRRAVRALQARREQGHEVHA